MTKSSVFPVVQVLFVNVLTFQSHLLSFNMSTDWDKSALKLEIWIGKVWKYEGSLRVLSQIHELIQYLLDFSQVKRVFNQLSLY